MQRTYALTLCGLQLAAALTANAVLANPALAANAPPEAIETILISGNRLGTPQRRDIYGGAVATVEATQLESRQVRHVADVLRDVPGVAVSRSGGIGAITQVRVRGGESNHTLVLLDGADLSDPFQGEFDFAGFTAADVARIEVLRGEQSALYGSDAIGGVINVLPRTGRGDLAFEARAEGGTNSSFEGGGNVGYGNDGADVFASVNRQRTDGYNVSRSGSETDGASSETAFVNAGLRPLPNLTLRALLRHVEARSDTDPQDFVFPDRPTQGLAIDGDETSTSEQRYGSLRAELSLFDGAWTTALTHAVADVERRAYSDDAPSFFTDGTRDRSSLISALRLQAGRGSHVITAALDRTQEQFRNVPTGTPGPEHARRRVDANGYVLALDSTLGEFGFGAAVRADRHDRFDDVNTWRLHASYRLANSGTRLRAAAGTGSKNPTNIELFGFNPRTFVGHPDLEPETSRSFDVGIDQWLLDERLVLGATWFRATLRDEIFTTFLPGFVASPRNRDSNSQRKGVELTADAQPLPALTVTAAWTWLDAEESRMEEVRRAPHVGSLSVGYRFASDRASTTLVVRYNGEQQDSEFINATPQSRATLNAFTLVNVNATYDLTPDATVFARIENVLDADYEEVFSYRAPGRSAYAGLRVRL